MNKCKLNLLWAACAATVALSACGGGDDDSAAPAPAPAPAEGGLYDVTKVDGRRFTKSAVASNEKTLSDLPAVHANTLHLGALPKEQTFYDYGPGKALKVGAARDLAPTQTDAGTRSTLTWSRNAAGQNVGALRVQAEGAKGLRLGLLVSSLPDAAVLQVSSTQSGRTVYEVTGAEVNARLADNAAAGETGSASRTWWTPDLGGDTVALQITLPAGADTSALAVSIPTLSHIFLAANTTSDQVKDIGDSDSCELDVTCYQTGANERDAVARMRYVKDGSSYLCTGTLLNDAAQSNRPYFLSANHCINTQTAASTLQTDWFFRSASCGRFQVMGAATTLSNGARLLYASATNDMLLVQLNDQPPSGAWMAGWDAAPNGVQSVFDIHHPSGDLAKISGGQVTSYSNCVANANCTPTSNPNAPYLQVTWSQGTTEGGSSGSGLLKSTGHVIGTLFGGSASCSYKQGTDNFGRLSVGFSNGMNRWLVAKDPSAL